MRENEVIQTDRKRKKLNIMQTSVLLSILWEKILIVVNPDEITLREICLSD